MEARRRHAGGGRPPRHLLSGLRKGGECGASFTIANARVYQCASYVNDGASACSNGVSVKRELVEARIMDRVRSDLADPAVFAEVELRFRKTIRSSKPNVIDSKRIAELQTEVGNLTEAVASGLLRTSPALAQRLALAAELGKLEAERVATPSITRLPPGIRERYRRLVAEIDRILAEGGEPARAAITDAVGLKIELCLMSRVGSSGTAPLLAAAGLSEIMVAGA